MLTKEEEPVMSSSVSTDVSELNFAYGEGSSQTLFLYANSEWQLSSVPDWIRPSVSRGNGDRSITFSTLSSNTTSTPRTGTIVISTLDQNVSVSVNQYGSAVTNCSVTPNHITTLSNGIAFDMDYSKAGNVAHYYRGYLEASRAGIMTNNEIIYTLEHEFKRHLPSDDEVADFSDLKPSTKYMVYTLAYDMNGKRGELLYKEVTTDLAVSNAPCGWIGQMSYTSSTWYWTVTKSATCYSYYMMTTENEDVALASDVLQAWWLEDAVRKGNASEYLNGGDWKQTRQGRMFAVWTRGVNSKGTYAGTIEWNMMYANSTRSVDADYSPVKNQSGDHSGRKLGVDEYKLYMLR